MAILIYCVDIFMKKSFMKLGACLALMSLWPSAWAIPPRCQMKTTGKPCEGESNASGNMSFKINPCGLRPVVTDVAVAVCCDYKEDDSDKIVNTFLGTTEQTRHDLPCIEITDEKYTTEALSKLLGQLNLEPRVWDELRSDRPQGWNESHPVYERRLQTEALIRTPYILIAEEVLTGNWVVLSDLNPSVAQSNLERDRYVQIEHDGRRYAQVRQIFIMSHHRLQPIEGKNFGGLELEADLGEPSFLQQLNANRKDNNHAWEVGVNLATPFPVYFSSLQSSTCVVQILEGLDQAGHSIRSGLHWLDNAPAAAAAAVPVAGDEPAAAPVPAASVSTALSLGVNFSPGRFWASPPSDQEVFEAKIQQLALLGGKCIFRENFAGWKSHEREQAIEAQVRELFGGSVTLFGKTVSEVMDSVHNQASRNYHCMCQVRDDFHKHLQMRECSSDYLLALRRREASGDLLTTQVNFQCLQASWPELSDSVLETPARGARKHGISSDSSKVIIQAVGGLIGYDAEGEVKRITHPSCSICTITHGVLMAFKDGKVLTDQNGCLPHMSANCGIQRYGDLLQALSYLYDIQTPFDQNSFCAAPFAVVAHKPDLEALKKEAASIKNRETIPGAEKVWRTPNFDMLDPVCLFADEGLKDVEEVFGKRRMSRTFVEYAQVFLIDADYVTGENLYLTPMDDVPMAKVVQEGLGQLSVEKGQGTLSSLSPHQYGKALKIDPRLVWMAYQTAMCNPKGMGFRS